VFAGLGPAVTHEVSRSITFASAPLASTIQNRQTDVEGYFILGAWL
jgi:hypothetical protein